MSKRFKQFDTRYAHHVGTALKTIERHGGRVPREDIERCTEWDEATFGAYTIVEQVKVQWAVYEHPTAEEWQKFRVSLKGLSTKEKLYCLAWRLAQYNKAEAIYRLELIRVNNYLGALIRGGQLNANLEVVR